MVDKKLSVEYRQTETAFTKLQKGWESTGAKAYAVQPSKYAQHKDKLEEIGKKFKSYRTPVAVFAVLLCIRNKEIMAKTANGKGLRAQPKEGLDELEKTKDSKKLYKDIFDRAAPSIKLHNQP